MQRDPVWKTDSRYKRAEIERAVFYHCDQVVRILQTLSNEKDELIWDASFNTWGQAIEIKASDNLLEKTNIRFQSYEREAKCCFARSARRSKVLLCSKRKEKQSAALLEAQGEAKCCFARSARRSKVLLCSKRKEKQSTALLEAQGYRNGTSL